MLRFDGIVKEERNIISKYEKVFEVTVKYYEGQPKFMQIIKLNSKAKTVVTGTIDYMACSEEQCTAPQKKLFSLKLN